MKFRVTVRGDDVELRGYLTGKTAVEAMHRVHSLAADMKPYGIVVASPCDPEYDPFFGEMEQS